MKLKNFVRLFSVASFSILSCCVVYIVSAKETYVDTDGTKIEWVIKNGPPSTGGKMLLVKGGNALHSYSRFGEIIHKKCIKENIDLRVVLTNPNKGLGYFYTTNSDLVILSYSTCTDLKVQYWPIEALGLNNRPGNRRIRKLYLDACEKNMPKLVISDDKISFDEKSHQFTELSETERQAELAKSAPIKLPVTTTERKSKSEPASRESSPEKEKPAQAHSSSAPPSPPDKPLPEVPLYPDAHAAYDPPLPYPGGTDAAPSAPSSVPAEQKSTSDEAAKKGKSKPAKARATEGTEEEKTIAKLLERNKELRRKLYQRRSSVKIDTSDDLVTLSPKRKIKVLENDNKALLEELQAIVEAERKAAAREREREAAAAADSDSYEDRSYRQTSSTSRSSASRQDLESRVAARRSALASAERTLAGLRNASAGTVKSQQQRVARARDDLQRAQKELDALR